MADSPGTDPSLKDTVHLMIDLRNESRVLVKYLHPQVADQLAADLSPADQEGVRGARIVQRAGGIFRRPVEVIEWGPGNIGRTRVYGEPSWADLREDYEYIDASRVARVVVAASVEDTIWQGDV